jgi:hypothetical protein
MNARCVPVVVSVALLVSGCASPPEPAAPAPSTSAAQTAPSPSEAGLPAGWRWESFGGVEVGVPGDWGWDNGSQRLHQYCVSRGDREPQPAVGRPGPTTMALCAGGDRSTDVATTGTIVAFEWTRQRGGIEHRGDRTTVRRNGVEVIVQAVGDLRRRIVATIRAADPDRNGCPATHPIGGRPGLRPGAPVDLTALGDVPVVVACRYRIGETTRLLSSLRLDGTATVRALAGAPVGGGPDEPESCAPEISYGDEVLVLRIGQRREVVVRYSGCDHNGIDDGIAVRTLTEAAVAPLLAGPNRPWSATGSDAKMAILGY